MHPRTLSLVAVSLLSALTLTKVLAQDAGSAEPTYVQLDCMKSRTPDYPDVEMDIWKPIHQELVNQGRKIRWAFYWVLYGDRSVCDYYTTNVMTASQLNAGTGFRDAFDAVHAGKDYDAMMDKTAASREMVWSQLWEIHDTVPPRGFSFMQINQMYTEDPDAYVAMEQDIYKPVHEALMADGVTAGWGLYELLSPHGAAIPYNYATADFLTSLGPIDFLSYIEKTHPDQDVDMLDEETSGVREVMSSEIWMIMDQTSPAD